ncbi:MAG: hypothetical protein IPK17_14065 [Chloroflexi bacterium]|uniref:hypothetical protein n=1 Tax=Candidatus Flexifilum breve TaxID=3140694 RepID=UPI0031368F71|nr:hypothetical protein [Chloroflexota bacterium]
MRRSNRSAAIGLIIAAAAQIGSWRKVRGNPLKLGAAVILILYTLYTGAAILLDFNFSGALYGIDQAQCSSNGWKTLRRWCCWKRRLRSP